MSKRWALVERVVAPDVDDPDEDFMVRWRVAQLPWCGVYVHRLNMPDRRTVLHDHPWPFVSLILRGGYAEDVGVRADKDPAGPITGRRSRSWRAGSVHIMRKTDAHTITALRRSPTWTLMLVGRRRRDPSWGYWEETGWTAHDEHPLDAQFAAAQAARQLSRPGSNCKGRLALCLSGVVMVIAGPGAVYLLLQGAWVRAGLELVAGAVCAWAFFRLRRHGQQRLHPSASAADDREGDEPAEHAEEATDEGGGSDQP